MFGIQPWGLAVVLGAWTGAFFATRRARAQGYDVRLFREALTWVVATGAIFGHLLDEAFYHPEVLLEHPLSLLHLLDGQSSCGGFTGAIVGGLLWSRLEVKRRGVLLSVARRAKPLPVLPFADVITSTFPITWIFARLGCALVHDHPGRLAAPSSWGSWFAVAWPTGPTDGIEHVFGPLHVVYGSTIRFDLGLLECFFTIALALGLAATWRGRPRLGSYTAAVCLLYAPVRFALDGLRVTGVPEADRRYASLTFAQWFCVAMFALGIVMLKRTRAETKEDTLAPLLEPAGTRPARSLPAQSS